MKVGDTVIVNDGSIHHGKTGTISSSYQGISIPAWNVRLDSGTYPVIEYELTLVPQSSSPKFKKGDRVQINDSSSQRGNLGTIVNTFGNIGWKVQLDNTGSDWDILESNLILVQSVPPNPQASPSKTTFQKGDRVFVDYQNTRRTATIADKAIGYIDCWHVLMDDGTNDMYYEGHLILNNHPLTQSTSTFVNLNATRNWGNPFIGIDQGIANNLLFGSDKTTPKSCKHKWKLYFGLQEKYEYCETCNEKRDTDRWS